MSNLVIYRFQPDAMDEGTLRKLFVGRKGLLDKMREEIKKAVDNKTPRYYLVVGPRGIGKSHFITLLYFELRELEDALCVKLSEDEFSTNRVSDLFMRIFEEIEGREFDGTHELKDKELVDIVLEDLKSRKKMIIVFVENLYQILKKQMDEKEVKFLRSIFQEESIFIVVATSPLIFDTISHGGEPFYNFFDIKNLRELSGNEIRKMIETIDKLEGKPGNIDSYYVKIDSIIKLTGGSPRIVILLYDLMCKSDIRDVEEAFLKILDENTPYYQDIFRSLPGQKRRILDVLISLGKPSTPIKIAEAARMDNGTVVTQLRRLEKDGYLLSHKINKHTKYEVRERLFRLWRERSKSFGKKRISILIEFIKLWYTTEERENEFMNVIGRLKTDPGLIREAKYLFWSLPDESRIKFLPKIIRESSEIPDVTGEFLEELIEIGDESLKRKYISKRLNTLWGNKKYGSLLEETEMIIGKSKKNDIAWVYKGFALWVLQRNEEALQALDKALEINPKHISAWNGRGIVLLDLTRYKEALQAFDKALEIDSKYVDAWCNKGFTLQNLERNGEALQAFDKALEINNRHGVAMSGRGLALLNLQRNEEALQAFDKALEITSVHADAQTWYSWYIRGFTLLNLQRNEEALQAFDKALEINPKHIYALTRKGSALLNLQRNEEALQAFDKALEINPEFVDALLEKGFTHLLIAIQESKRDNYGNFIKNLNSAIDYLLKTWDEYNDRVKMIIIEFFKDLTLLKQVRVIDSSLEIISERKDELKEFLKPISIALEIVKTKNLKKYYDLQVEERDIVADIVERLTGSTELLPEEYRKGRDTTMRRE
jgi:tetratricopeptide (TPR) repeat protein